MTDLDLFVLGGRQDDADLLAAHRRLIDLLPRWLGKIGPPLSDEELDALTKAAYEEIPFINSTPPKTLLGAAIKMSVLAAPSYGMEAGDREDDYLSLRQLAEFLARESGLPPVDNGDDGDEEDEEEAAPPAPPDPIVLLDEECGAAYERGEIATAEAVEIRMSETTPTTLEGLKTLAENAQNLIEAKPLLARRMLDGVRDGMGKQPFGQAIIVLALLDLFQTELDNEVRHPAALAKARTAAEAVQVALEAMLAAVDNGGGEA